MGYQKKKQHRSRLVIILLVGACLVLSAASYIHTSQKTHDDDVLFSLSEQTPAPHHAKPSKTVAAQPALVKPSHDYVIPPVSKGLAPVLVALPTKEPVVFLGIDDGANKQDFELQMMKDNSIHASIFLAKRFIADKPQFFKTLEYQGSEIEDHSLTHRLLAGVSYEEQKQEICGMSDYIYQQYGHRPTFFRPPGGSYDQNTQKATADCGMKAVVVWHAKANGGSMQYQSGHALKPGDIVLMHFRPEFKSDMQAFIDAEKAAGLHTELLEDWLN